MRKRTDDGVRQTGIESGEIWTHSWSWRETIQKKRDSGSDRWEEMIEGGIERAARGGRKDGNGRGKREGETEKQSQKPS